MASDDRALSVSKILLRAKARVTKLEDPQKPTLSLGFRDKPQDSPLALRIRITSSQGQLSLYSLVLPWVYDVWALSSVSETSLAVWTSEQEH